MYAALTVSRLPEDLVKQGLDHPHGLGNIWRWLASEKLSLFKPKTGSEDDNHMANVVYPEIL